MTGPRFTFPSPQILQPNMVITVYTDILAYIGARQLLGGVVIVK